MAHRNRWFTVLKSMVNLSMANCECHNQRVIFGILWDHSSRKYLLTDFWIFVAKIREDVYVDTSPLQEDLEHHR
jgi:hypothetical protein